MCIRDSSKLKLITIYLCTTTRKKLSGRIALSVKYESARSIAINKITNTFASDNAVRSQKFQIKEN